METFDSILGDIGNFSLVVFGFTATLFTVIYSFIINKREYLKEINDKIKLGNIDPILTQRKSNSIKYITSMKRLNFHLIICLFSSLGLYILSLIAKYLPMDICLKKYAVLIIGGLTAIISIQIIYVLVTTVKKYINETKI